MSSADYERLLSQQKNEEDEFLSQDSFDSIDLSENELEDEKKKLQETKVRVIPFVYLCFCLIIFFLCTSCSHLSIRSKKPVAKEPSKIQTNLRVKIQLKDLKAFLFSDDELETLPNPLHGETEDNHLKIELTRFGYLLSDS